MNKEKILKLQVLMICLSVVGFETAIYLWKPTYITIFLLLGVNGLIASFIIELLSDNFDN